MKLNRFNTIDYQRFSRLFCYGVAAILFVLFIGCKKKERLSASTFAFAITPPAATVLYTSSITLTAHGVSAAGAVETSPTWTISPATAGVLNTDIGNQVIFDPGDSLDNFLGDVIVTAVHNGIMAQSRLAVINYIPDTTDPDLYELYTDNGLPMESGLSVDIFINPSGGAGMVEIEELSTGYTPEGITYQRMSNAETGQSWGITYGGGQSKDLSGFSGGALVFSVQLSRALVGGEVITIQIEAPLATKASVASSSGDWDGFSAASSSWQEVTIPIADFSTGGFDLTQVKSPFIILMTNISGVQSALSIDVDAVRWEK